MHKSCRGSKGLQPLTCGHDILATLALRFLTRPTLPTRSTQRCLSTSASKRQTGVQEKGDKARLGSAFESDARDESVADRDAAMLNLFNIVEARNAEKWTVSPQKGTHSEQVRLVTCPPVARQSTGSRTHLKRGGTKIARPSSPSISSSTGSHTVHSLDQKPRTSGSLDPQASHSSPQLRHVEETPSHSQRPTRIGPVPKEDSHNSISVGKVDAERNRPSNHHRSNGHRPKELTRSTSSLQALQENQKMPFLWRSISVEESTVVAKQSKKAKPVWIRLYRRRASTSIAHLKKYSTTLPNWDPLLHIRNKRQRLFCEEAIAKLKTGCDEQDIATIFAGDEDGGGTFFMWSYLMLAILHNAPASALDALLAAHANQRLPGEVISACLEHIAVYLLQKDATVNQTQMSIDTPAALALHSAIKSLLSKNDKACGLIKITNHTVYLLRSSLGTENLKDLINLLLVSNQQASDTVMLSVVYRFVQENRMEEAMTLLEELSRRGSNVRGPIAESVCCTMLHRIINTGHSDTSVPELFTRILAIGITPNLIFYNLHVLHAIKSKDSETAWRILDLMVGANIEPDAYTLSTLLNDAKWQDSLSDIDTIKRMIDQKGIRSEYLVTDLLHFLLIQHTETSEKDSSVSSSPTPLASVRQSVFSKMLPLFAQNFSLEPLRLLLPSHTFHTLSETATRDGIFEELQPRLKDSAHALTLMLTAYLCSYTGSYTSLGLIYKSFRQLVVEAHPRVLPLVETSRVYDRFLMAFASGSATLPLCASVLSDMLSHDTNPTILGEKHDKHSAGSVEKSTYAVKHCRPSVFTWSILLKAYMDHGQYLAAERVLELMRHHGITPSSVTWNSLIIGYAKKEDVPNVISAMERSGRKDFEGDRYVLDALSKITNREALDAAMKVMSRMKQEIAVGTADGGLSHKSASVKAAAGTESTTHTEHVSAAGQ